MKVFKAKNNTGTTEVALSDIMFDEGKSVVDVAEHWAIFQKQRTMHFDIERNGLNNPIIVKQDGDVLRFAASGCRIQYAVLNGYTHVDALLFDNDEAILAEMEKQRADDDSILGSINALESK